MKKEIKKILVIRFRRVGDATLSVSLCSSLKKSFPGADVHYIVNENIAPLFVNHPGVDKVITFSDYDMSKTSRYLKKVKSIVSSEKYDIIVDTRATLKTLAFSLFSLHTPYRIGRKKKYSLFAHNFRIDSYARGCMDNVTATLKLLDPLSKDFKIIKDPDFKLYVSAEDKASYSLYLKAKGVDLNKPIMICAVTARIESKVWAKDKMAEILKKVADKYKDIQLIFNYGGDREKKAALSIYNAMGRPSQVFIDIEAKNLFEFKALTSLSSFFFGNEGGPRHIAQAFGIPAFAIYPPNVKKIDWLPNPSATNQGIELLDINPEVAQDKNLSFEKKLDMIDVQSVWAKLDEMLDSCLKNS